MKVKEVLENPELKAVVEDCAPRLLNFPVKIFSNKKCGEVFDIVVGKGIIPKRKAEEMEERINRLL